VNRRFLITGGSGFIAQYLARALTKEGEVIMHIRQTSKTPTLDLSGVIYIRSSSLDDEVIRQSLPGGIDTVFHLAGAASSPNALSMVYSNIVTTANIISLMATMGIPNLIFLSTAAVWSGAVDCRIEESFPAAPDTNYGYSKLAAESLIADAVARGVISSATFIRSNGSYGFGSRQGVVAQFYNCLRNCKAVSIDGDGLQLREPLYVTDLVEIMLRASTRADGLQIYSASGPQTLTVLDIAKTISTVLNAELKIKWNPERSDRNRHIILSTVKAHQFLDWKPRIYLKDGLQMMISLESQNLSI
jgi:UDP-glucose 4-epimerase